MTKENILKLFNKYEIFNINNRMLVKWMLDIKLKNKNEDKFFSYRKLSF